MLDPLWLAAFFGASEVAITALLRSRTASSATDKGSLRLIWIVVLASMLAATLVYFKLSHARLPAADVFYWIGLTLYVGGIALRWYAIAYLGRYFTVDVTLSADHKVVDRGPYKYIRHPSYTGVLAAFTGLWLCFGNYVSLLVGLIPTFAVFLYRVRIEEDALRAGLGDAYARYMARTKRLIPFVY